MSIIETTAGSVTSTQFVWAWSKDLMRLYQPCEERDASGAVTKEFFDRGQMNSTTKYFYAPDHHPSVVVMTDNSGNKVAEYAFDPFGQVVKLSESVSSDFGYAGYYVHARSGLNLTRFRAYNANRARWLSRDPIGEYRINAATNVFQSLENTDENNPYERKSSLYKLETSFCSGHLQ